MISKGKTGIYFIYFYILMAFLAPILGNIWSQISLYALLCAGGLAILLNIGKFKLLYYHIWYTLLMVIALTSCLYAIDSEQAFSSLYSLLVVFGLTMAITALISKKEDINKVFVCFSVSSFILFIALLLTNNLIVDERLGQSLFGNANTFAVYIMLALICSIWLVLNNRTYLRILFLIIASSQFYMLLLSGGRKYVLISLAFIYVLLIYKAGKEQKIKMVQYTVIFLGILALGYWAVFNIPQLYNSIGWRMESFFALFGGQTDVLYTDMKREVMIAYGLDFWVQRPLLGYGLNNYKILFAQVYGETAYSHNNFIEMLVNLGLLGFVAYYSFYLYLIYHLWRKKDYVTNPGSFFLVFMICLFPLELGVVSYNMNLIQIFIALANSYLCLTESEQVRN